jgi:hypothetical protein
MPPSSRFWKPRLRRRHYTGAARAEWDMESYRVQKQGDPAHLPSQLASVTD